MEDDDRIIAKVAIRAADANRRADMDAPPPPVPLRDPVLLTRVETELGFALPGLLKRLYLEVGDGSFGPGYGLFGASSGHWLSDEPFTLAELYHTNHKDEWPDGLVPICDWGCAIWSCIDCLAAGFPMIMSDPNYADVEAGVDRLAFLPEQIGFAAWIEAWADGVDLWERWAGLSRRGAAPDRGRG